MQGHTLPKRYRTEVDEATPLQARLRATVRIVAQVVFEILLAGALLALAAHHAQAAETPSAEVVVAVAGIPGPGTLALVGVGLLALLALVRFRS